MAICDANRRLFRGRFAFVNAPLRSVARDHGPRSTLGPHRSKRSCVHAHRIAARTATDRLPTTVRGLVVSYRAASGSLVPAKNTESVESLAIFVVRP